MPVDEQSVPQALEILVVDDSADARDSLALVVKLCGHRVSRAGDGETALALAQRRPPDAALLDIGLPGMSGYELGQRLRELGLSPRPFLVAVTGYGQAEDRARSRAAGFDLHLVKPVEPEMLEKVLRSVAHLRNKAVARASPEA